MTPKDKAMELVYKYENLVTSWDCYYYTCILVENRLPDMKECALIAVDEILKIIEDNCLEYDDNYWQEVRQEIENL